MKTKWIYGTAASVFVMLTPLVILAQGPNIGTAPTYYTLSIFATNGSVTKFPNKTSYVAGEAVTLTATPNAGYVFRQWTGSSIEKSNPLTIVISTNRTITAEFVKNTQSPTKTYDETITEDSISRFKNISKKAEAGDAEAQYVLGEIYRRGDGVQKSKDDAKKWFSKSAELGHVKSRCHLILINEKNKDITQDDRDAIASLTNIAVQGDADSQNTIGWMYANGRGVPEDYREAVKWFTKAAVLGYAPAQFNLSGMYYLGEGVPQNYKEAFKWATKAAEQGYAGAQSILGDLYKNGKGVPKDYKKAIVWYTKAAEQGDADAQYYLGSMYSEGQGVPQNDKMAVEWITKAAEQGDVVSQSELGWCYADGKGVPQDYKEAVKWLTKAATSGDPSSQVLLGRIYSAMPSAKYPITQALLDSIYRNSQGVPKDYIEAYKWLNLAAAEDELAVKERDILKKMMSPSQIAEAQQRCMEFKSTGEYLLGISFERLLHF